MSWLTKWFGGGDGAKYERTMVPLVTAINEWEAKIELLTDLALAGKTAEFRARLTAGAELEALLPEAFAVVREAARRTLGQRHYDVQLLGGIALHQSKIIEMRTGEGKTLVCTLPAYLNALTGRGVHVITVNDYLARRDTVWMGQIYAALGLSVGVINHEASYLYHPENPNLDERRDQVGSFQVVHEFLQPCSRREAYAADITYGTNNEFGFDYLRDNLAREPEQVTQILPPARARHHYAIVDEVDSILIDEARTPLIIAAPVAESESLYQTFAKIAGRLTRETDYTVDEKTKTISLTEAGIERAEKSLGVENIYTDGGIKYVHHLETATRAQALFLRDRDYVVKPAPTGASGDGEIVIVDEFTGRLQPGRRWSEGLHQAIEAKEGVAVKQETRTFASVTFQNYFKLYDKLAGMTGTALTSAEEFLRVYGLETVAVPTHRPNARRDFNDLIFQSEAGKWRAVTKKIKELHASGQPVLVGTVSIEKNEQLAAYLTREGVPHRLLNAKNNEEEGAIIAEAGRRGNVVIATNLAGRGVDIKLGGAAATPEAADEVRHLGGLFVLGTERHEARRIDNQLRGRSGRQGDPGETQFYLSLDDDIARIFAPAKVKGLMARFKIPEDEPIEHRLVSRAIENAQEKIEGLNFDLRKHLLDYDNVLNQQRTAVYERRRRVLFGDRTATAEFLTLAPAETLAAKQAELSEEIFWREAGRLVLQVIDLFWVEHLEAMEYLRGSVRLRAYGQRDPLVEYRREGLRIFKELEGRMIEETTKLFPALGAHLKEESVALREVHEGVKLIDQDSNFKFSNSTAQFSNPPLAAGQNQNQRPKVGRNDPCPCGSGKKWKKCHGK